MKKSILFCAGLMCVTLMRDYVEAARATAKHEEYIIDVNDEKISLEPNELMKYIDEKKSKRIVSPSYDRVLRAIFAMANVAHGLGLQGYEREYFTNCLDIVRRSGQAEVPEGIEVALQQKDKFDQWLRIILEKYADEYYDRYYKGMFCFPIDRLYGLADQYVKLIDNTYKQLEQAGVSPVDVKTFVQNRPVTSLRVMLPQCSEPVTQLFNEIIEYSIMYEPLLNKFINNGMLDVEKFVPMISKLRETPIWYSQRQPLHRMIRLASARGIRLGGKQSRHVDTLKDQDALVAIIAKNTQEDQKFNDVIEQFCETSEHGEYFGKDMWLDAVKTSDIGKLSFKDSKHVWCEKFSIPAVLPIRTSYLGDIAKGRLWHEFSNNEVDHGWKIHISAYPHTAARVLELVLPILFKHRVHAKMAFDVRALRYLQLDSIFNKNVSQLGKFITVYTRSDDEADVIATEIDAAFKKAGLSLKAFPPCVGEFMIGDTGGIFVRYVTDYNDQNWPGERETPLIPSDKKGIPPRHPFRLGLTYLGEKVPQDGFAAYVQSPEKAEEVKRLGLNQDILRPSW